MTIDIVDERDNRRLALKNSLSWRGDEVRDFRSVADHLSMPDWERSHVLFLHVGQHQQGAMEALRGKYVHLNVVSYSGSALVAEEMLQHHRGFARHHWYKRTMQSAGDPSAPLPSPIAEDLHGFILALEKDPETAGAALDRVDWMREASLELLIHLAQGTFDRFQEDELFRHVARFDAKHDRKLMALIEAKDLRGVREYLLDRHEFI